MLPEVEEVLADLAEHVAIPSISRSGPAAHMRRAATWLAARLDLASSWIEPTDGSPVIRGEWLGAPGAPTVLVYSHYDAQLTGSLDEWTDPPFALVRDGDVVCGRGVTDDKGLCSSSSHASAPSSSRAAVCRSP